MAMDIIALDGVITAQEAKVPSTLCFTILRKCEKENNFNRRRRVSIL